MADGPIWWPKPPGRPTGSPAPYWNLELGTNKDMSLIMRGRLYSSCVRSSMLHGTETWPVRKENVVALQRAEMRMVRRMYDVKLKDRLPSKELRETRYR